MTIRNLIIIGMLIITAGCGPVDEVPNGIFNITGPQGEECEVEITNTDFVVSKDCLDLLEKPQVPVRTNNLASITDWDSAQGIPIGTRVQVVTDPLGDNVFLDVIDKGWIETTQGLTVFLEFENNITEEQATRWQNSRSPIIFSGELDTKGVINLINARIVNP